MGLAEDLKALQDLRGKSEISEAEYTQSRDSIMRKHGAGASSSVKVGRAVGFVAIPIGIAIIAVLIYSTFTSSSNSSSRLNSPQQRAFEQAMLQPTPRAVPVTNGALTINAGGISWYPFTVPPNATDITLNGHFNATGGFGNDIIAYVTDDDGLANLKNRHEARVWFNSQKVTQSTITASLPNTPGTYYLVFDNRFSFITPKAVQVNATLNYMMR
jgi:hypothetical protein